MSENINPFNKECLRCGHKWLARIAGRPVQCPKCKNTKWDERRADMMKYQATRDEAAKMLREVRNAGWLVKTVNPGREFELFGGAAGFARLVVANRKAQQ